MSEEDQAAIKSFVLDALSNWSDAEIDQHLEDLKRKIKALGDHAGMAPEDYEMGCWVEALRDFDSFMRQS